MPDWENEILRRLAAQRLNPADEAAIVQEWAQDLEQRFQELRNEGTSEADAFRAVLSELNEPDPVRIDMKRAPMLEPIQPGAASRGNRIGDFAKDVRYGLRMLRKNPGFTAVVVLTLALGIGANTTVFTVLNTLLLHPLPVHDPSRLLAVCTRDNKNRLLQVSYLNYQDYRARNQVFSGVAAYTPVLPVTMSNAAGGERIFAEMVTSNYFDTLGIRPVMGRFFTAEEGRTPGAAPVAVLGYGAWQQRFGAVPDMLGKKIRLNNIVFTVIGVAPPGFRGINAVFGPDLWLPITMAERVSPVQFHNFVDDRSHLDFKVAGRLQPGVSMSTARANLKTIGAALAHEYPNANEGRSVDVIPLADAALGDTRQPVILGGAVLMAIVGIVLLIACSNIANLLLARAAGRRQEIATRLAIGASRGRLMRQLLTESVLLALFGGALGLLIAGEGCRLIWSFFPAEYAQNFVQPRFDGAVFAFVLVVSVVTGLIFGFAPAIQSSHTDLAEALKEETRTAGRSHRAVSFGNALLAAQVALSLVSLVTAALFFRSMERAYSIDPGFQTKHLLIALTNPGQAGYSRSRTEQFYREVRERLRAFPGIADVSWASNLPFFARAFRGIFIEGQSQTRSSDAITTLTNTVDLDYFRTVDIAFERGRDFNDSDRAGSTPVAIVNDDLAARYWPGQDAIGKRFKFAGETSYRQIVGVVRTANYQSLGEAPQPCVYLPLKQNFADWATLYVRTTRDPASLITGIQREIRSVAPEVDVSDVRTGRKLVDQAMFWARIGVGLLGVFGALALALACVGLYGMMAYSVNRRRREIGVRIAMGAGQAAVLRLVLLQGMRVVAIGVAVGIAAAFALARMLAHQLYGVGASDPISFIAAPLVLMGVAALACYWPARRASRVDPLAALRDA